MATRRNGWLKASAVGLIGACVGAAGLLLAQHRWSVEQGEKREDKAEHRGAAGAALAAEVTATTEWRKQHDGWSKGVHAEYIGHVQRTNERLAVIETRLDSILPVIGGLPDRLDRIAIQNRRVIEHLERHP